MTQTTGPSAAAPRPAPSYDPVALGRPVVVRRLTAKPEPVGAWLRELWDHREVAGALARKDFQVRYKRAALGVLWAVAVPLVQAVVLAFVFERFVRIEVENFSYSAYVMTGVVVWSYVGGTVMAASTAIVDGAGLTDKVWFPRAILALVPSVANLVGFVISMALLLVLLPVLDVGYSADLLLMIPAFVLLVAFVSSVGLVLSALYVYFRDVKYLVTAGLLVWFYVTPIIYPQSELGSAAKWLDLNPATGIVALFQRAVAGPQIEIGRATAISVGVTAVLLLIGCSAQRRHDRLFVDQL
jgi:lipopolysaccharide transport system permease protein